MGLYRYCLDRITMGKGPFKKFVEVGRVAFLTLGPHSQKLAVIVDVIDGRRALIDGPCSGVPRQEYKFANMHLTNFTVKINHSDHSAHVRKAWEAADISTKWDNSKWAQNLRKRAQRASITDYDRFKLGKAKQARNKIINRAFFQLKKKVSKASA